MNKFVLYFDLDNVCNTLCYAKCYQATTFLHTSHVKNSNYRTCGYSVNKTLHPVLRIQDGIIRATFYMVVCLEQHSHWFLSVLSIQHMNTQPSTYSLINAVTSSSVQNDTTGLSLLVPLQRVKVLHDRLKVGGFQNNLSFLIQQ